MRAGTEGGEATVVRDESLGHSGSARDKRWADPRSTGGAGMGSGATSQVSLSASGQAAHSLTSSGETWQEVHKAQVTRVSFCITKHY